MPYARLPDRAVLDLTGETAEPFLQNLVTSDLDLLGPDEARPSALLAPQGKILFDFLVSRLDGGLRLDVAAGAREALVKRLTLYRLRAKVAFTAADMPVFALWDAPDAAAPVDRRFVTGTVRRCYGEAPAGLEEASPDHFEALRLRAGVAEAESDFPSSEMFPHDVLLDQNGGVSFKKGCYIGQEVVSRMQHRGTARRRIMLVQADGHLTPGAVILAGEKPIGTVLSAVAGEGNDGGEGIGLLRIDKLAAALAGDLLLSADGVPVEIAIPAWAGYDLPLPAPLDGDEA
ncbi:aminomethyltransferase [Aureimonas sp. SA4125]|uniref:CAF17-like 4Fe-4S cluster assembly/insertion protein YgfZ n=1 Tax=Aureimonas sp. SA4125 TaxID=2826993 RepID=UPI001CC653C8|nr:folate-binding protein [Aureimonas sp. SA4125]BDA83840.1 aminomethyltransferase [Aureimonas sp. SA4125]